jgi:uncharacterized membrane protein
MLHACTAVTGAVLWANLHLLFWLSLVPFTTAWMGENHFARDPTIAYGVVLLMAAIGYTFLQKCILAVNGPTSPLARAVGSDRKGMISLVLYGVAIVSAIAQPAIAWILYVTVALVWFIPDRRVERILQQ